MRKLLFLLFLIPLTLYGYIGTNACVRLCFPQSEKYKPEVGWEVRETPKGWQVYQVPAGVYAITYNPDQWVDRYQIILQDLTTNETILWKEGDAVNSQEVRLITDGSLIKANKDVQIGKKYKMILKTTDLNGFVFTDTAIIQIKRRENGK